MLTGINLAETKEYKSKLDPDLENPTIFKIGVLDTFIKSYLEDKGASFEFDQQNPETSPVNAIVKDAQNRILIVKLGVKEVINFIDPATEKPVQFNLTRMAIGGKSYDVLPDRVINLFSQDLIKELSTVIMGANKLKETEEKNS